MLRRRKPNAAPAAIPGPARNAKCVHLQNSLAPAPDAGFVQFESRKNACKTIH